MKFDTLALHAGIKPDETGARQVPIHQATAFVFKDSKHAADLFSLKEMGYSYSRLTNPTISALQERLAALEGGTGATACASGHAAQLTAFHNLLQNGDEYIASTRLYGGSQNQFRNTFKQFGWNANFVDCDNHDLVKNSINEKTKFIFVEGISTPGGVVMDIEALAKIAHDAGIPLIVDNTIATAALCKPIQYGADIVVGSTTKYMSGHGAAMGGIIVEGGNFNWAQNDKFPMMTQPDAGYHGLKFYETFGNMAFTVRSIAIGLRDIGACQSSMNAFLTMLGLETLSLRMQKHSENALKVAEWLEKHPKVNWVSYAGLKSSKYNSLVQKYLPKGASSVFTFSIKGGDTESKSVVSSCKLLSHVANIGDSRSLITHPSSTTHSQLDEAGKVRAGATPDIIRLSIGLEDIEDIIADLDQALKTI
jgi:O-acetylhomoserine (thiol)-lyase